MATAIKRTYVYRENKMTFRAVKGGKILLPLKSLLLEPKDIFTYLQEKPFPKIIG